jgi:hypothetical protein
MSNSAMWAMSAANKFREVARTTENPNTKVLAEGLTHLAEAIRALDALRDGGGGDCGCVPGLGVPGCDLHGPAGPSEVW